MNLRLILAQFSEQVMNKRLLLGFICGAAFVAGLSGCDETRGCMDPKADNFAPAADKDDGSCIPPRNKLIGFFDFWMYRIRVINDNGNVLSDTVFTPGFVHITESNIDRLLFNANFNGMYVVKGSVNRFEITFAQQVVNDTVSFNGTGIWHTEPTDTVDMTLNLTSSWSIPNYSINTTYSFYCTKR